MEKVQETDLYKLKKFFTDIRFYMGKSVLDGVMGEAYADNINNPNFAILIARQYCFMSGKIDECNLKKIIDENLKTYKLIPADNLKTLIEDIYGNNINKSERYSIKKDVIFDISKLEKMAKNLHLDFEIKKIDENLANRIKIDNFIKINDNYKENGIGYCCIKDNEIIGVASSNIFYKDGIEVNIKVREDFRRKGIATILASNLILECLKENKKISWDAANMNSVKLAEKLGFEYDSTYNIYNFTT